MGKRRKQSYPSNITHLPEVEGPDIECPIEDYIDNPFKKVNDDLPFDNLNKDYKEGEIE